MSGADDLRNAFEYAAQCWYADGMVNGREYGELADALLAVVADPVRRLAILDAMGLDVTETTVMPDGSMYPFHPSGPEPQRILVVRPHGEASS